MLGLVSFGSHFPLLAILCGDRLRGSLRSPVGWANTTEQLRNKQHTSEENSRRLTVAAADARRGQSRFAQVHEPLTTGCSGVRKPLPAAGALAQQAQRATLHEVAAADVRIVST